MYLFLLFLLLPLLFFLFEFFLFKKSQRYAPYLTTLLSFLLILLLLIIYNLPEYHLFSISIISNVPIDISFNLDKLGWLMSLFCCIVWLASSLFSIYYMRNDPLKDIKRYQLFSILNLYVILMIFVSSNMITFFIFFELLLIVSYVLIIHYRTQETFAAGLRYLFFQIIGGLMLLFAVILTYASLGTTNFIAGGYIELINNPFFSLIFWCYIIGFSIKAGLFPVHIWLPEAHPVAPAPASAILSGMVIKTGTFGILRVFVGLFGIENLAGRQDLIILILLAIFTMFWGAAIAIGQGHLKRILAYSSVSQVGYIILGTAFLSPISLLGALIHTLAHSLVKSMLFLCAGSIVDDSGCPDVSRISGYGAQNPFIFSIFTIGALSMIGFPLLISFVSKWILGIGLLEAYQLGFFPLWIFIFSLFVLLLSSVLNATYYIPILIRGWFYAPQNGIKSYKLHWSQVVSLSLLAFLVVAFGIVVYPLVFLSIEAFSPLIPFFDFSFSF